MEKNGGQCGWAYGEVYELGGPVIPGKVGVDNFMLMISNFGTKLWPKKTFLVMATKKGYKIQKKWIRKRNNTFFDIQDQDQHKNTIDCCEHVMTPTLRKLYFCH